MIPADYFDRPDTPAKNSPIGRIMRQLDVIYPDKPAEELRAVAKDRIHSGGPGKVKWSRAEAQTLKDARSLPGSKAGEQFLSAGKVATLRRPTAAPEMGISAGLDQ